MRFHLKTIEEWIDVPGRELCVERVLMEGDARRPGQKEITQEQEGGGHIQTCLTESYWQFSLYQDWSSVPR